MPRPHRGQVPPAGGALVGRTSGGKARGGVEHGQGGCCGARLKAGDCLMGNTAPGTERASLRGMLIWLRPVRWSALLPVIILLSPVGIGVGLNGRLVSVSVGSVVVSYVCRVGSVVSYVS